MVTIEVNLKEGDAEPEQHLDEGENIERRIVPLSELYDTLQGIVKPISPTPAWRPTCIPLQPYQKKMARSWMLGRLPIVPNSSKFGRVEADVYVQAISLGPRSSLEHTHLRQAKLTHSLVNYRTGSARLRP